MTYSEEMFRKEQQGKRPGDEFLAAHGFTLAQLIGVIDVRLQQGDYTEIPYRKNFVTASGPATITGRFIQVDLNIPFSFEVVTAVMKEYSKHGWKYMVAHPSDRSPPRHDSGHIEFPHFDWTKGKHTPYQNRYGFAGGQQGFGYGYSGNGPLPQRIPHFAPPQLMILQFFVQDYHVQQDSAITKAEFKHLTDITNAIELNTTAYATEIDSVMEMVKVHLGNAKNEDKGETGARQRALEGIEQTLRLSGTALVSTYMPYVNELFSILKQVQARTGFTIEPLSGSVGNIMQRARDTNHEQTAEVASGLSRYDGSYKPPQRAFEVVKKEQVGDGNLLDQLHPGEESVVSRHAAADNLLEVLKKARTVLFVLHTSNMEYKDMREELTKLAHGDIFPSMSDQVSAHLVDLLEKLSKDFPSFERMQSDYESLYAKLDELLGVVPQTLNPQSNAA